MNAVRLFSAAILMLTVCVIGRADVAPFRNSGGNRSLPPPYPLPPEPIDYRLQRSYPPPYGYYPVWQPYYVRPVIYGPYPGPLPYPTPLPYPYVPVVWPRPQPIRYVPMPGPGAAPSPGATPTPGAIPPIGLDAPQTPTPIRASMIGLALSGVAVSGGLWLTRRA